MLTGDHSARYVLAHLILRTGLTRGPGLETLGIMHPHWHSASPDTQRRLISLFIQSLAPKSPTLTLSPTSPAFATAFESEISSTRSPHDVAAVLRWGLRHLELEGSSFGREDGWYKNFFEAERTSLYPNNAFSTLLGPQLPQSHLDLLTATLEVFSSLAAHAEANGISGSKLSKFFGLWLLVSDRVRENDDWPTFYARWEQTGRVLEHLFLSRIRSASLLLLFLRFFSDHSIGKRLSAPGFLLVFWSWLTIIRTTRLVHRHPMQTFFLVPVFRLAGMTRCSFASKQSY